MTLRGLTLEEEAIEVIREYEPPEGYWLAFSGGKDSMVIHKLAELAGVRFDAHFNVTTVDPPEVVAFIKKNYPAVRFERPKDSMFRIIITHGIPPTRKIRYCCRELKEIGGTGRLVMLGVRRSESRGRGKRLIFDESKRVQGKFHLNPILEWQTRDVWEFIHRHGLPYCELYDRGRTRIGCILCPLQGLRGRERDIQDYPKFVKAYILTFDRMLEHLREEGKNIPEIWTSGEAVFKWWIWGDHLDQKSSLQKTPPVKPLMISEGGA